MATWRELTVDEQLRGRGRLFNGAGLLYSVFYEVVTQKGRLHTERGEVVEGALGEVNGQLMKLDGSTDFWDVRDFEDLVLELDDSRRWPCNVAVDGGATNRGGLQPPRK